MYKPTKILVPIDFSVFSEEAVRAGSEYAGIFGAELVLCHVIAPSLYPEGMGFGSPTADDVAGEAEKHLSKLAEQEVDPKVSWEVRIWSGIPHAMVSSQAREMNVDMIILPTHGRTGLSHMLVGSTAERVVRTAPCQVLVLCCAGSKKET